MTPKGITRHLLAILSADVKDYTRLMSQDDVGTIRTLAAYKEVMETLRQMSPVGEAKKVLAASLAYLGRMEEAHAEAEKFMKDDPTFSASDWASHAPFLHEKDHQHAVEGYIKAGLPR